MATDGRALLRATELTTTQSRYDAANLECDLVMKGGITSGVVYPLAVCRVAEKYRLRNIGGASAGAIARGGRWAGEYGRATGSRAKARGFEGLEFLPAKLTAEVGPAKQPRLLSLFQPTDERSPSSRSCCRHRQDRALAKGGRRAGRRRRRATPCGRWLGLYSPRRR